MVSTGCDWTDDRVYDPVLLCCCSRAAGSSSSDLWDETQERGRICPHTVLWTSINQCTSIHTDPVSMSTASEPGVGSSRSLSAAKRHRTVRKNSRRIYSAYQHHQQGWVTFVIFNLIIFIVIKYLRTILLYVKAIFALIHYSTYLNTLIRLISNKNSSLYYAVYVAIQKHNLLLHVIIVCKFTHDLFLISQKCPMFILNVYILNWRGGHYVVYMCLIWQALFFSEFQWQSQFSLCIYLQLLGWRRWR